MTRTTFRILGLAAAGLVAAGATAFAHGAGAAGHFGRHGGARFVQAIVDDALDAAAATDQQRATIQTAWARVTAAVTEHRDARRGTRDEIVALFEADDLDRAKLDGVRGEVEAAHRKIADAVAQALIETHGALTPEQRKAVAEYARSVGPRRGR